MIKIKFLREALLHDISNLAYVAADVCGESRSPHALHQAFDICQPGNIDRVDRILCLAFSEAALLLKELADAAVVATDGKCFPASRLRLSDEHLSPAILSLSFKKEVTGAGSLRHGPGSTHFNSGWATPRVSSIEALRIRELMHEYLTASVLADWLAITLPESAPAWTARASEAFSRLRDTIAAIRKIKPPVMSRSLSPF